MVCDHIPKTMDEGADDGRVAGNLVKRSKLLIGVSGEGSEGSVPEGEEHQECEVCHGDPRRLSVKSTKTFVLVAHTSRSACQSIQCQMSFLCNVQVKLTNSQQGFVKSIMQLIAQ